MKKIITKTERTYFVYDISNKLVGVWKSPREVMSDLHLSGSNLLYKSINSKCYISNNINEKIQYRIELDKKKVKTTIEVADKRKDKPYSEYFKSFREYVEKLPDDAKEVKYIPGISGLYLTPDGKIFGTDINGIFIMEPYLNKCESKHNHNKHGYYRFHYQKKMFRLHNVLARLFVPGYEDGLVVDHINGISTDNRLENLQWITLSDNSKKFHSEEKTPEDEARHREAVRKAQLERWSKIPPEERGKYSNLSEHNGNHREPKQRRELTPEEKAEARMKKSMAAKARWEALPEAEKERRRKLGKENAKKYWDSLSEDEKERIREYGRNAHNSK